jgi:hypothetical protein
MANILDYRVIQTESRLELITEVNKAIVQGWQPLGGVSVYSEDTFCGPRPRFAQAVVNYEAQ